MRSFRKTDDQPKQPKTRQPKTPQAQLLEWVLTIAGAVLLVFLVQAYVVKPYKIPSGSMEPTLVPGERVLVSRISMQLGGPHVGDIVVFYPPTGAEEGLCGASGQGQGTSSACDKPNPQEDKTVTFIKRIVAGPGDTIYIKDGHVYRNGKLEADSFANPCTGNLEQCTFTTPIKIPPGHWFMMGDNRGNSEDSRFWGPVPTSWIVGIEFATYWPLNRVF